MEIITLPVGQLRANSYLVFDSRSRDCLIIDPGDDADYIQRKISDNQLIPGQIVATHGHFDHIMAVLELKLAFEIPFKINSKDQFLVTNMSSSARHFIGIDPGPVPPIDGGIKNKDTVRIGKSKLTVIATPGYTPGSVCLYNQEESVLFTGDTLFADSGIGRTDFSYSNHQLILDSLKNIFSLPAKTIIYPGHGRSSTLKEEKSYHLPYE